MIRQVNISNFKSIDDLQFDLGRFNVFIGENGCGKSNILEALALGGAASANQLNKEFLTSRGIRVSRPELMRSGFKKVNLKNSISIDFVLDKEGVPLPSERFRKLDQNLDLLESSYSRKLSFQLKNDNKPYSEWYDVDRREVVSKLPEFLSDMFSGKTNQELEKVLESEDKKKLYTLKSFVQNLLPSDEMESFLHGRGAKAIMEEIYEKDKYNELLSEFTIYSPENTFLRKFEDEEKIQPLGIKGEGLFKLLKVFGQESRQTSLKKLKKYLKIIDWFEDFEIPNTAFEGEKIMKLKDRFIGDKILIQQHNANEGFLFLLFYLSLFISKDTPKFFAIDNIEASFNPKLCSEITSIFHELSKKEDKQVLMTTHNPYILDGLNLKDDNQRLFVVKRNNEGKTMVKRIDYKKSSVKLSEAWMLGYIGGLPKNF